MLSISIIGPILAALVNTILGAFTVINNPRKLSNRLFGLLCFSLSAWIIANLLAERDLTNSLFWTRLTFATVVWGLYAVLLFANNFPSPKVTRSWLSRLALGAGLVMSIVCFLPAFIPAVEVVGGISTVIPGPIYLSFVIYFLACFVGAMVFIISSYRRSHGLDLLRVRFLLLGLGLMISLSSMTNLILPLALGNNNWAGLGAYFTLIFVSLTTYAIVRHSLFDIKTVVVRSVAYTLLLATLATFYSFASFTAANFIFDSSVSRWQQLFNVVLTIILAFIFQPLRHFFEKLTDRVFFRDHYDTQEVLNKVGKILTAELHLEKILNKTLKILSEELRIGRAQFIVFEGARIYKIGHYGPLPDKLLTAPELRVLNHRMLVADELDGGERKNLMMAHGVRLSLAIRTKEEFVGFLLLGDKLSGDIYSAQDVKLLEILGSEVAVAIVNAKAYEEIAQFNVTLQDKIAQATQNLRVANRHLKELDKAKDEFISMASHQLRTPLTTIKGYLSMLEEGDAGRLKPQQQEFVTNAYEGSERMVRLISDLLNVSRMSTGKFLIEKKPTNLVEMVNDEVRQLQMHANNKGLKLSFVAPKRKLPLVSVDEAKTRQVVMNFIDNAIYYTKSGSVTVYLDQHEGYARMRVVDTGIGVPKEAQKQLFTKFFRAGNAQNVRPDGTGLGLFLAKKVIQDQGGKIIFDSEEGKGSVFGFEIPLDTRPKTTPQAAPSAKVEIGVN